MIRLPKPTQNVLRTLTAVACLLISTSFLPTARAADAPLHIMTFNIRYNNPGDGFNAWPHRVELVESMIRFHTADAFGVQEALHEQMMDLAGKLPDYAWLGVGRDDGESEGEYSGIFYKRSRLTALESETFWLSEHPEKPGFGWDARHNRVVTWALFQDKKTGKRFYLFNTHFDHRGEIARRESAKLILKELQSMNVGDMPVLVMGDFNMTPESEPYRILTDKTHPNYLKDAWLNSQRPPHGPSSTWSGFAFPGVPDRRIDHIFFRNRVSVLRCGSLSESWSGRFPSDHLPVWAEVLIDPPQPLPRAHAHNDYEHERPLLDALEQGFTSVEADIWLIDGELYVSHDRPAPQNRKTLRELYMDPLAAQVDANQGTVYPGTSEPFMLMIDFKNEGLATYRELARQLEDYAYLLHHQAGNRNIRGPVRIFISGDRPIEAVRSDSIQYAGVDGRPDDLGQGFTPDFMPVISQHFRKVLNWNGKGSMPDSERKKLETLVERAHTEGKKVRLWATPESEALWQVLYESGVDLINTDELERLKDFLLSRQ